MRLCRNRRIHAALSTAAPADAVVKTKHPVAKIATGCQNFFAGLLYPVDLVLVSTVYRTGAPS